VTVSGGGERERSFLSPVAYLFHELVQDLSVSLIGPRREEQLVRHLNGPDGRHTMERRARARGRGERGEERKRKEERRASPRACRFGRGSLNGRRVAGSHWRYCDADDVVLVV
jgi:hypothetical protein